MRVLKKELWPYRVVLNAPESITEMEVWLGLQLGTFKDRWNVVYHSDQTHFYFRLGEDATLFALKWAA